MSPSATYPSVSLPSMLNTHTEVKNVVEFVTQSLQRENEPGVMLKMKDIVTYPSARQMEIFYHIFLFWKRRGVMFGVCVKKTAPEGLEILQALLGVTTVLLIFGTMLSDKLELPRRQAKTDCTSISGEVNRAIQKLTGACLNRPLFRRFGFLLIRFRRHGLGGRGWTLGH